jgi:hypothetical protein
MQFLLCMLTFSLFLFISLCIFSVPRRQIKLSQRLLPYLVFLKMLSLMITVYSNTLCPWGMQDDENLIDILNCVRENIEIVLWVAFQTILIVNLMGGGSVSWMDRKKILVIFQTGLATVMHG